MPEQVVAEAGHDQPNFDITPRPGYKIARTAPDELLRHDISDEELDMLCGFQREGIREGMWAAIGAAGGAIPGGMASLVMYFKDTSMPLMPIDLAQIIVLAVMAVTAIVMIVIVVCTRQSGKPLQDRIRERTRQVASGN